MKKKILVFGGTFNPPHLGHQLMVEQVLLKPLKGVVFDQLWLLPVGQHSFAKKFVSNQHRLAMLNLMKEDLFLKNPSLQNKIFIEHYEVNREEESQTFMTLESLAKLHPTCDFSFLIGSDNLLKLHLWHDYQLMLKKYPFYIYPRASYAFFPLYEGVQTLDDFPQVAVSSTTVREALLNHTSLNNLLNDKVINYIKENKLYVTD